MNPFIEQTLRAILKIISTPFSHPELLWQLIPVFLLWIIMELYFGTHKKEKLGWNTALGNGISLFWIVISGMQYMFLNNKKAFAWNKFIFILTIMIYAIFIIVTSFKHTFSSKTTYTISSPTPIYYFSLIALIYTFGVIELNIYMITAIFSLYLFVMLFWYIFKRLLPESEKDTEDEKDDFKSDFGTSSDLGGLDSSYGQTTPSQPDPFANSSNLGTTNTQNNNDFNLEDDFKL